MRERQEIIQTEEDLQARDRKTAGEVSVGQQEDGVVRWNRHEKKTQTKYRGSNTDKDMKEDRSRLTKAGKR